MKKIKPVYLSVVFLLSAILFVACSQDSVIDENINSKTNTNKNSLFYGFENNQGYSSRINEVNRVRCVSVGIDLGIISISTNVCCWRWSAHSPTYQCSWGSKKDNVLVDENTFKGYIDVEQLGAAVLKVIEDNDLKKLKINKSIAYEEDGHIYKVKVGEYTIEKDDNGRFLTVDLSIKEKKHLSNNQ